MRLGPGLGAAACSGGRGFELAGDRQCRV